ncbi:MAG: phospholipase [Bacteroidetes bacterium]|nr:MAG: phospholipase [Bacteroidota bacterium]
MKQKVALVLSGGGAKGLAHIGVIEELERQGFEISSIAGTSMGAVVGAVYGLGKMQEFKQWQYSFDKLEVFKLLDFTLSAQGLIKGDKVFNKMKTFIDDRNIEDLDIPLSFVAVDVINNKEVVFEKGDVFDAIRASVAIPTVITPVKTKDGLLVDGGVLNNIPFSRVKRIDGDILVGVNVNANIPLIEPKISQKESEIRKSNYLRRLKEYKSYFSKMHNKDKEKIGYFDLINKTINLMIDHNAQVSMRDYKPDILIETSRDLCSTFDFYKARRVVEAGRYAAKLKLEEWKK